MYTLMLCIVCVCVCVRVGKCICVSFQKAHGLWATSICFRGKSDDDKWKWMDKKSRSAAGHYVINLSVSVWLTEIYVVIFRIPIPTEPRVMFGRSIKYAWGKSKIENYLHFVRYLLYHHGHMPLYIHRWPSINDKWKLCSRIIHYVYVMLMLFSSVNILCILCYRW